MRQWYTAYAVAYNNRNVSDATFAQLYPADLRQDHAERILADVGTGEFPTEYSPGPRPVIVTDVSVEESGNLAVVTTCAYDWFWEAYDTEDAARSTTMAASATSGTAMKNTVEMQPDGTFTVTGRERPENDSCRL